MNHLGGYLKLALRAQSQCRSTWEGLATIQNPPVMATSAKPTSPKVRSR